MKLGKFSVRGWQVALVSVVALVLFFGVFYPLEAYYPVTKRVYPNTTTLRGGESYTLTVPINKGSSVTPVQAELICESNINLRGSNNPRVNVNGMDMISQMYPGGPLQWGERNGRYYFNLAFINNWGCCGNLPITLKNVGSNSIRLSSCTVLWKESSRTRQYAYLCGNNPRHRICSGDPIIITTPDPITPPSESILAQYLSWLRGILDILFGWLI